MSDAVAVLAPEKALKTARRLFKRKGREILVWYDPAGYKICADGDGNNPLGAITGETFEWLRDGGFISEHSTLVSIQGRKVYEFQKNVVSGVE